MEQSERQAMIEYILKNQVLEATEDEIKTVVGKIETYYCFDSCIICHTLPIEPV